VQLWRDVLHGEGDGQPWHLDSSVPWQKLNRKRWVPLSCVLLLCDGWATPCAGQVPNFWESSDSDAQIAEQVVKSLEQLETKWISRRAGYFKLFAGGVFLCLSCAFLLIAWIKQLA